MRLESLYVELCLRERRLDSALEGIRVRSADRVGHFFRIETRCNDLFGGLALLEMSDQDLVERGVIEAECLLVFGTW